MNYATEQTITKPPILPGAIWGLLQAERSEVCQALLNKDRPANTDISGTHEIEAADESIREVEWRHCQNLQECLRRIDDALDRLSEGTYGHCGDCGAPIEHKRLVADPAASLCIACQHRAEGERAFATL
jgi:RNA polymerase-binding protein DksA